MRQITLIEHSVVFTIAVNNSYAKLQPGCCLRLRLPVVEAQPHEGQAEYPRRQLWTQDRAAAEAVQAIHIQWEGKDGLGKRGRA